jgi:hypothetical protein
MKTKTKWVVCSLLAPKKAPSYLPIETLNCFTQKKKCCVGRIIINDQFFCHEQNTFRAFNPIQAEETYSMVTASRFWLSLHFL